MSKVFQRRDLVFQDESDMIDPYKVKSVFPGLSEISNSKHLVFDIRQLDPGHYSFPYHFHRNAEELMMILSGSMTMRIPEGLRILNQGDIVFFEIGETGAHQFYNHDSIPCTYLDIKTVAGLDVCEYPDSGKINISPYQEIFDKDSRVDYFKGEENVAAKWKEIERKNGRR